MSQSFSVADPPPQSECINFLLEPGTWRTGVLSLLLDALDAALPGGPVVVLGVGDKHVARLWSGAVAMLCAAGTMNEFRWQHVEDPSQNGGDAHLVTVPLTTLDAWAGPGVVLIGEEDNCSIGELSVDPHQTERGSSVTVTPWSLLAEAVLVDSEAALGALELHRSLEAKFEKGTLHRLWPLAMTVASSPKMHESMGAAGEVIRAHSPWELADHTELFNLAVGAVAGGCGRDAAIEWRDSVVAGPVSESVVIAPDPQIRTLLMGEATDLAVDALQWGCSVSWAQPESSPLDVDLVAFLLDENRKVNGDEDFVFYNTPVGGGGAVQLSVSSPDTQRVSIDFGVLASRYHRVALGIVITGAGSFSQLNPLRMTLSERHSTVADSVFRHGTTEQAMIVAEFYSRAGRWRVRPVWQGFDGGLAELATSYGVVVDGHG